MKLSIADVDTKHFQFNFMFLDRSLKGEGRRERVEGREEMVEGLG